MATIQTPCTKVCVLDEASGLCIGCGRTADEIGAWTSLAPAARDAIIAALPARLVRHGLARQNARKAPETG